MAASTTSGQGRFELPGLNLPLNWSPSPYLPNEKDEDDIYNEVQRVIYGDGKKVFPTALSETQYGSEQCSQPALYLRELIMVKMMNLITDKKGWEEKVFDETISQKWKTEALESPGVDMTQKMVDWVIEELRWKAKDFKETRALTILNGLVTKSDDAVPDNIKAELQEAVIKLEDIPEVYKDYHPGSDGKVVDLVHPSLFPLTYGVSRILKDKIINVEDCLEMAGLGEIIPVPPKDQRQIGTVERRYYFEDQSGHQEQTYPFSDKFQWLPCDIAFSGEDGAAKIASYINNLHPQRHKNLYNIIGKIIDAAIPLWSMTLEPLDPLRENPNRLKRFHYELEFDPDPDAMDYPALLEDEDEDEYWERKREWETAVRRAVPPEPGVFSPPGPELGQVWNRLSEKWVKYLPFNMKKEYKDRGLQVIVKLANIELSPENPKYEGGSWHVEGEMNEHICATALYYYSSENITESKLAFRQQVDTDLHDLSYPQEVHGWVSEIFGCNPRGPAIQNIGSVICKEGRLVTFPNVMQHRVQPFELDDETKPGHRKILALFLVDPGIRIISTANVPPQQRDWWAEEIEKKSRGAEKGLGGLSPELREQIVRAVDDFPISMEKAKEVREKLMEERKVYVKWQDGVFTSTEFSLCEH